MVNMSRRPVILLSSVGRLNESLKISGSDQTLVVALDEVARKKAITEGVDYRSVGDYLSLSESELRSKADLFSKTWYLSDGVYFSRFDGYSLAELMYVDIGYKLFFEIERRILMLQAIKEAENPDRWILSTDENHLLTKLLLPLLNNPKNIGSKSADYSYHRHGIWQRGKCGGSIEKRGVRLYRQADRLQKIPDGDRTGPGKTKIEKGGLSPPKLPRGKIQHKTVRVFIRCNE